MTWLSWSQGMTLWWDVAGNGPSGLYVPDVAIQQPEVTSHTVLFEVTQLTLTCSTAMGVGGVGGEKWICMFVALFFPVGSTAMSIDHLGWNAASAPS